MARAFAEEKLIVASHNKGKLVEIADLLSRFHVKIRLARMRWACRSRKKPATHLLPMLN